MQRVPPLDRKIDDRHVDRADQRQHRARAVGAAGVVDRVAQSDDAEVEEQQDQFGCHPRIPRPVGAPGRSTPQRAGPQRDEGHQRTGGGERLRHHRGKPRVEAERQRAPRRHHEVDEHRHPGRRHVDEDDPVGLALLEIGRRDAEADPDADRGQDRRRPSEPGNQLSRDRIELGRRRVSEPIERGHVSTRPAARRVLTAPPRGAANAVSVGVVSS